MAQFPTSASTTASTPEPARPAQSFASGEVGEWDVVFHLYLYRIFVVFVRY